MMKKFYFIALLMLPTVTFSAESVEIKPVERACSVNLDIARYPVPPTPNNMTLPDFGKGIIGWASGPEGAQAKLDTVNIQDIQVYKEKGVDLAMVQAWHAFYTNETERNPCNPTAPIRAQLMLKIIDLWQ